MSVKLKLGLVSGLLIGSLSAGCSSAPARDLEVQTSFTLAPGEERNECYRMNVDQDVFISKISTSAAPGVHHQILAVAKEKEPEGVTACDLALDASESWIFQIGDAAGEFQMPTGVAYHLREGSQLLLQLHLFNPRDTPLESTLTLDLTGIAADEVVDFAQLVAAGTLKIDLPPGQAATATGKCTLDKDVSVFGLVPHMHYLGTTFKAWVANGGEDEMLFDGPFLGLGAQPFEVFEPVAMPTGASLNVECSYFNTTSERVVYGSSALDEMCFVVTYYYPAIEGQNPLCLN